MSGIFNTSCLWATFSFTDTLVKTSIAVLADFKAFLNLNILGAAATSQSAKGTNCILCAFLSVRVCPFPSDRWAHPAVHAEVHAAHGEQPGVRLHAPHQLRHQQEERELRVQRGRREWGPRWPALRPLAIAAALWLPHPSVGLFFFCPVQRHIFFINNSINTIVPSSAMYEAMAALQSSL